MSSRNVDNVDSYAGGLAGVSSTGTIITPNVPGAVDLGSVSAPFGAIYTYGLDVGGTDMLALAADYTSHVDQDVRTTADVTFERVNASSLVYAPTVAATEFINTPMINLQQSSEQLVFTQNSGRATAVTCVETASPSGAEYKIPDVGAAGDFMLTSGSQTVTGVTNFSNGLTLGTSNASTLSDYEVFSFTTTLVGWTTPAAITLMFVRVGQAVTMTSTLSSYVRNFGTASMLSTTTQFPSRFCPVNTVTLMTWGLNGGAEIATWITVSSIGYLSIVCEHGANFSTGATTVGSITGAWVTTMTSSALAQELPSNGSAPARVEEKQFPPLLTTTEPDPDDEWFTLKAT